MVPAVSCLPEMLPQRKVAALGCVQRLRGKESWHSSTAREPQGLVCPNQLSISPPTLSYGALVLLRGLIALVTCSLCSCVHRQGQARGTSLT